MPGEVLTMMDEDLGVTVESDFASPVALIAPDGTMINTNSHDATGATPLYGIVHYDYQKIEPTGETVIVNEPVVMLRISSLSRVPRAGENWAISIPTSPSDRTPKMFKLGGTRAPEIAATIGFIRLFPIAAVQS